MTLDVLTFECAPMKARLSQHECERQIATGLLDRMTEVIGKLLNHIWASGDYYGKDYNNAITNAYFMLKPE